MVRGMGSLAATLGVVLVVGLRGAGRRVVDEGHGPRVVDGELEAMGEALLSLIERGRVARG